MTTITACPTASVSTVNIMKEFSASNVIVTDWVTSENNVSMNIGGTRKRSQIRFAGTTGELLAIASALYIGDECIDRSKTEDFWKRDINIVFPFRYGSTLREHTNLLSETLQFVSGDNIQVSPMEHPTGRFSFILQRPTIRRYDAVCLFSGGADSLSGIINLLEAGKHLCLVSHYADSLTTSIQQRILIQLRRLYPNQIDHKSCFVRSKRGKNPHIFPLPDKGENTHRVRSILFLSLGAIYAELFRQNELYIPENGIIGLNVPLDSARVGALSTRTTHPLLLTKFSSLLSAMTGNEMKVLNPFLLNSKFELVASVPERARPVLLSSHSCARYDMLRFQKAGPGVKHCGYCLPCLYRRMAFHRIDLDDRAHYLVDIFQDLHTLTHTKSNDVRALGSMLKRYQSMNQSKKRALMMFNGTIPTTELRALYADNTLSVDSFVDMFDRFVDDALVTLKEVCSRRAISILDL